MLRANVPILNLLDVVDIRLQLSKSFLYRLLFVRAYFGLQIAIELPSPALKAALEKKPLAAGRLLLMETTTLARQHVVVSPWK